MADSMIASGAAAPGAARLRRMAPLMLAAVALLSACSFTPTYQRPDLPVPKNLAGGDVSASAAPAPASAAASAVSSVAELPWRSYFPDARLQSLVCEALVHNRDLRVAILNIEQLRTAYQIQRADQFPTLNASVNATRQPSTLPPFRLLGTATAGLAIPAFELDLFGRVQALSDAAAAQVLASEEARRSVHISLVASVASAYYTLWADRWQLALAEQTLLTRQNSAKLQQLKYDTGVLNELDLRAAQSTVEAARVARAQAQRAVAQDVQALALLVGRPVPDEWMPPQANLDFKDPAQFVKASLWPGLSELPVGLSSEVLLQRPDVAQAEQSLVVANANIGAARAARFPRIALTGSAGAASSSLSGLFEDPRFAWSVGGSLLAPILDAGRTAAAVDSALVRRDIAIAQYDKAVQTAFREVADALVARRTFAEQAEAQLAQAQAEAARLRLSTLRYDNGVASQLDLLDAQRALFTAQQAHITAQLARQQAHIGVYKALGGGWVEAGQQADARSATPSAMR